jgi:hypothetical protein
VLKVVYYHMKLELSAALQGRGRQAVVNVRVAYLSYLILVPRITRKDKKLAEEAERRFKSVYKLVVAGLAARGSRDEAWLHVWEIERLALLALET